MASRIQRIVLTLAAVLTAAPAHAQQDGLGETEPVLEPEVERRSVSEADIDAENFEIGLWTGLMAIENFDTSPLVGARLAYHISPAVFFEAGALQARSGETSFETLSGGVDLLTDEQRDFLSYNASIAYNILPGESFIGGERAYNTAFYLIGGAGMTEFAGDENFTVNAGMGYRVLLTDWLSVRMEMRDHIFDLDVFGENRTTQNLGWSLGISGFF
jgi:outer membrane beta-barrel protein